MEVGISILLKMRDSHNRILILSPIPQEENDISPRRAANSISRHPPPANSPPYEEAVAGSSSPPARGGVARTPLLPEEGWPEAGVVGAGDEVVGAADGVVLS